MTHLQVLLLRTFVESLKLYLLSVIKHSDPCPHFKTFLFLLLSQTTCHMHVLMSMKVHVHVHDVTVSVCQREREREEGERKEHVPCRAELLAGHLRWVM